MFKYLIRNTSCQVWKELLQAQPNHMHVLEKQLATSPLFQDAICEHISVRAKGVTQFPQAGLPEAVWRGGSAHATSAWLLPVHLGCNSSETQSTNSAVDFAQKCWSWLQRPGCFWFYCCRCIWNYKIFCLKVTIYYTEVGRGEEDRVLLLFSYSHHPIPILLFARSSLTETLPRPLCCCTFRCDRTTSSWTVRTRFWGEGIDRGWCVFHGVVLPTTSLASCWNDATAVSVSCRLYTLIPGKQKHFSKSLCWLGRNTEIAFYQNEKHFLSLMGNSKNSLKEE